MEKAVMEVLLRTLLEQNLITNDTYTAALNLVHSTIDLPPFFRYDVCCHKRATERSEALGESQKEGDNNGRTKS